MPSKRSRLVLTLLVAMTVLSAGCLGGLTGDGGPSTDTEEPADQGDGANDGGDDGSDGDGSDGASTATATSVPGTTVTATPTPTPTATPTPTPGSTPTETASEPGDSVAFSPDEHTAGIEAAGSYTIDYTIEGLSGGNSEGMISGVEQVDVDTGSRYSSLTSTTAEGNISIEYYVPPNSDTGYQRGFGQTSEVSAGDAMFLNFTDPGTGETADAWPAFSESGSGETDLGSATVYVVDDVEDLPDSTRDQYDTIESVDFRLWVDDDTGVIAKYDYELQYVDDGEEGTVRMTIELSDLGSTTVERPDWVPDE